MKKFYKFYSFTLCSILLISINSYSSTLNDDERQNISKTTVKPSELHIQINPDENDEKLSVLETISKSYDDKKLTGIQNISHLSILQTPIDEVTHKKLAEKISTSRPRATSLSYDPLTGIDTYVNNIILSTEDISFDALIRSSQYKANGAYRVLTFLRFSVGVLGLFGYAGASNCEETKTNQALFIAISLPSFLSHFTARQQETYMENKNQISNKRKKFMEIALQNFERSHHDRISDVQYGETRSARFTTLLELRLSQHVQSKPDNFFQILRSFFYFHSPDYQQYCQDKECTCNTQN